MNKTQASELIQNTFPGAFDRTRFRSFVINVLNRLDEGKAHQWSTQYVKDAFKAHVHRYERLGTYTSPDGETLDVLIVYLTEGSKLERARTAIRNFVADHLKKRDEKDAALVAFVSSTERQWRFSYVKMEYATVEKESGKGFPEQSRRVGVEARLTPARRFSYLVGEGESCHTAQTRFLPLLQDTSSDPSLADIEDAFSVEAVTKEFFARYAALFIELNAALEKLVSKDKTLRDEFNAKHISNVDFSKKLMGQIVFLYFLQKKGWLGVRKGEDWGAGPHNFLRRMAGGEHGSYESFFNDVLEPLFYDTLATDRGHDAWCNRFKCRIPFLNGGLFEPLGDYDWCNVDIKLPNELFRNDDYVEEGITGTGVLDVFDRYNFTVNEAEPLEKEVAIDPEMLGKVFENLIEENRRKGLGAFYTPREIVHYMCQESLINYLDTAVNGDKEAVLRSDIETFVRLGEQISHYESVEAKYAFKMPKSIEKNARDLDNALKNITVCDPAVGSGAFPVGMMTEIVRARAALTPYFNDFDERTPYHFKRHAIQNSLYGVDIDMGAVEIAKLRLWLSLIVDEEDVKQVKPLPNLDYKIVVGNSLIELLSSASLHASTDAERTDLVNRLKRAKDQMFDLTSSDDKKGKRGEIDRLFLYLFEYDRAKRMEGIRQLLSGITGQGQLFEGTSQKEQRAIDDLEASLEEVRAIRIPKSSDHFEWGINFSEIFHAQRGFDVVIANPPYIFARESNKKGITSADKKFFYANYTLAEYQVNLYPLFIEKGTRVLRPKGCLCFITPNNWLTINTNKTLRKFVLQKSDITIVNFYARVFESADVDSAIVLFRNSPDKRVLCLYEYDTELRFIKETESSQFLNQRNHVINIEAFKAGGTAALLQKIDDGAIPLSSLSDVKSGLVAYEVGKGTPSLTKEMKDSRIYHSLRREDDTYHRYLDGQDVCRYYLCWGGQWLKYGNNLAAPRKNFRLYSTERILVRQIPAKPPYCIHACLTDKKILNDRNSMNVINIREQPEYVLGVLNSKLVSWWFIHKFGKLQRGTFPQFKVNELADFPMPKNAPKSRDRIAALAKSILDAKDSDPNADTLVMEKEVDLLVYRLFNLELDEIALIENSLSGARGAK